MYYYLHLLSTIIPHQTIVGFAHSCTKDDITLFVMLLELIKIEMSNTNIHRNVCLVYLLPTLGMLTLPVRRPFLGNNLSIKSKQDDLRLTSTNLSSLRVSDHFSNITPTSHTFKPLTSFSKLNVKSVQLEDISQFSSWWRIVFID